MTEELLKFLYDAFGYFVILVGFYLLIRGLHALAEADIRLCVLGQLGLFVGFDLRVRAYFRNEFDQLKRRIHSLERGERRPRRKTKNEW